MSATSTYSEEELVLLLKQQSREAFNYLYDSYASALFGIIYKVINNEATAEDVLQEVFVKIWNNVDKYDNKKGRLYTWMLNIARNAAIDKLRSKGEIMKGKIQTGENHVNSTLGMMGTEVSTDTIGLRKEVSGLRTEYATIVDMAYFNGFTLEEISERLKIPLGTVKTRMRSALKELRAIYNVN